MSHNKKIKISETVAIAAIRQNKHNFNFDKILRRDRYCTFENSFPFTTELTQVSWFTGVCSVKT